LTCPIKITLSNSSNSFQILIYMHFEGMWSVAEYHEKECKDARGNNCGSTGDDSKESYEIDGSRPIGAMDNVLDVITTVYQIKTGHLPKDGTLISAKPFSRHKAKAIRLGDHTFHTFVIRTPNQRRTYSRSGEEDPVLLSRRYHEDGDNG